MKNLVEQAKNQIRDMLTAAAEKAAEAGQFPEGAELAPFTVERPADVQNGDFASNAAMVSARNLHMAPVRIAAALSEHLNLEGSMFERCDIAGPGFMNFRLAPVWFAKDLQAVSEEKEA